MIGSKPKIIIIGILVAAVAGVIGLLLVSRQKAQARSIEMSRKADSLSFVAMTLQKQVEAMVGLGDYGIDTVWAPPLAALVLQWHSYTNYMSAMPLTHSTGAILITKKACNI